MGEASGEGGESEGATGDSNAEGDAGGLESQVAICESSESCEYSESSKYATAQGTGYLPMAVYRDVNETDTEEDFSELESMIRKSYEEGRIPDSEIARNPEQVKPTMRYLRAVLEEYLSNPEKYDSLAAYLSSKGRQIRAYTAEGVFDDNAKAVARTHAEAGTFEANIRFREAVENMARGYGLAYDDALEMVITHELIHLAQPKGVYSGQPFPYIAEMDAELLLTEYFGAKALSYPRQHEMRERYGNVSRAAAHRFNAVKNAMEKGIKINASAYSK